LPVPLPLAVALVLIAALLIPFAIRAARRDVQPSPTTTIVRVPVEVPVVQEKIVTRVVYRDRQALSELQTRDRRFACGKHFREIAKNRSDACRSNRFQTI
jgi:hypothetical protein